MTFIEFIGFIITMVAFFLLMVKQARDERRRRHHPEEYEEELEEQEEAVRELLESLHIKTEEPVSVQKRKEPPIDTISTYQEDKFRREARELLTDKRVTKPRKKAFEMPHKKARVDLVDLAPHHDEAYVLRKKQQARVLGALSDVENLKNAVIIREILGPPKGFQ